MFEILFANWGPPCRVLTENFSEWFSVFFLTYRPDGRVLISIGLTWWLEGSLRGKRFGEVYDSILSSGLGELGARVRCKNRMG